MTTRKSSNATLAIHSDLQEGDFILSASGCVCCHPIVMNEVVMRQPETIMKTIQSVFLIGLVTVTISSGPAEVNEAVSKDLTQLQGEWSMVSGSADGQPMPDEMRRQMKRVCKGDETTTTWGEQVFLKAKITIDPSKMPKTIDYEMTEGFTKGKKQLGIYEVDGDTFKSCFGKPDDERPTDFTSKPGDGRTLSVWKREKSAAVPERK
jgi:uncharacterized protein (TIGR03067 family)